MNTEVEGILREAYAKFNARDIDGVIALMHPDVEWPNAWEGGWWTLIRRMEVVGE